MSLPLAAEIHHAGYVFLPAVAALPQISACGSLADWPQFAASWQRLLPDDYMADGGRYRRRRHAVFHADANAGITRLADQAHYQSLNYNALNGGVARNFEPIETAIAETETLRAVLHFCLKVFGALAPAVTSWQIEIHQFRIEAQAGVMGLPTPEGSHRDGVDYALVLLVRRENIISGTTTIHTPDGQALGSFTLTEPGDAMLLDDARVFHGVTPVEPAKPEQAACRDVLVVTFRRSE